MFSLPLAKGLRKKIESGTFKRIKKCKRYKPKPIPLSPQTPMTDTTRGSPSSLKMIHIQLPEKPASQ
jgi:hypothetical protein